MLKAILIDDEQHCINRLEGLLRKNAPDIEIVARCKTIEGAKSEISLQSPDILFLDVQLGRDTGFDLLSQINYVDIEVIFTTSYDKYALKAIKFSALDYLLKPIDRSDLSHAIQKLKRYRNLRDTSKKIEVLLSNIKENNTSSERIAIPTLEGYTMVDTRDIIRFQSDANYSHIHLKSNNKITASKTIKYFEEILAHRNFFRVHKSHLVNLSYVETYVKGKGGYITLNDGTKIEVAVRRKEELIKKLISKT